MASIDELLDADATNERCTKQLLSRLQPSALAVLEDAAAMYTTFCRCVGLSEPFAQDDPELMRVAAELGLTPEELVQRIKSSDPAPELASARAAWVQARANYARATVLLACQRHFMWGATDLLRGRVTAASGYLRQQVESVALLRLFADPNVAEAWQQISNDETGRVFYRQYQSQLLSQMSPFLRDAYDRGSAAALHVRMAALARGLRWTEPGESQSSLASLGLSFQEFDTQQPFRYILAVLNFLEVQRSLFEALTVAFPEAYDPIWTERVRIFTADVQGVRRAIEASFPEEVRALTA